MVRKATTEAGEEIRYVIPKGFEEITTFSKASGGGIVNFAEYGCKSEAELRTLINNMNDYLAENTEAGNKISFKLMKDAGTTSAKVIDGIGEVSVKYDNLGFPIFEGSYVKGGVNLSNLQEEVSKGLKKQFEDEASTLGKSLNELLTEKGFNENE